MAMTRDEFLHKYHEYQTQSKESAIAEANRVNEIGIEDSIAVVVEFPGYGFCLMLDCAADACLKMEIPIEVTR